LYETLDDDLDIKDDKLEVLMSTTLVTHMRKVLAADKAAMSVLGRIRGSRLPPISDEADEVKTPSDYPLPPSPVSCTPSDSSDKGNFIGFYQLQVCFFHIRSKLLFRMIVIIIIMVYISL
jgi:hypothetical protein